MARLFENFCFTDNAPKNNNRFFFYFKINYTIYCRRQIQRDITPTKSNNKHRGMIKYRIIIVLYT